MSAPWFDPNTWAWLPGTSLGVATGLWGALVGVLAPRGRGRRPILAGGMLLATTSLASLAASGVALAAGQPYAVWYGLGLPGLIGTIVVGSLLPTVAARYSQAEQRRIRALDLSMADEG